MSTPTVEERLSSLEAEVEQMKQQREADQLDKSDEATPWWERIVGVFENNPEFEKAVRYGQKWCASEDDFDNGGAV